MSQFTIASYLGEARPNRRVLQTRHFIARASDKSIVSILIWLSSTYSFVTLVGRGEDANIIVHETTFPFIFNANHLLELFISIEIFVGERVGEQFAMECIGFALSVCPSLPTYQLGN